MDATVIAAVPTSFEEDQDCLKTDHSTMSCSEPLIIVFDYETAKKIIKFAASTMGDVYVLSLTCTQWNEVINTIPYTAHPIWYKIARRYYDGRNFRGIIFLDSYRNHGTRLTIVICVVLIMLSFSCTYPLEPSKYSHSLFSLLDTLMLSSVLCLIFALLHKLLPNFQNLAILFVLYIEH
jgi:hypothetical protein